MNNNNPDTSINSDIDLYHIYKILITKKYLIGGITFISFLISCLIALSLKRTWEGRFEIVVSNTSENNINTSFIKSNLANIAGLSQIGDSKINLKTEVGILQSPSVLMPIFNFIVEEKIKEYPNFKNKSFLNWRNKNLNIDLVKQSSILKISYKDQDKNLILPVLEKISNTYKDYSTEKKKKAIQLTLIFLEDQISSYKVNALDSFKKAQKFALANNLIYTLGKEDVLPKIELEKYIVKQRLKSLKSQLDGIQKLELNNTELSRIISGYDLLKDQELSKLDLLINIKKEKYKENDIVIKRLNTKKENLIKLLIEKQINTLKAEIFTLENETKASLLDEDKLIKFKELTTISNRDQLTLNNLEDLYRKTKLEQAKLENPWKLITTPTLLKSPVSTPRKVVTLIGAFIGMTIAIIYSLWVEKNKDIVNFDFELRNLFKNCFVFKLDFNNKEKINTLFKDLILLNPNKDIVILDLLNINDNFKQKISNLISKNDWESNIELKSELLKNDESKFVFLILKLREITNKEIKEIKQRIDLYNLNINGILFIE